MRKSTFVVVLGAAAAFQGCPTPPPQFPIRQASACKAPNQAVESWNTLFADYFAPGKLGHCADAACHASQAALEAKLEASNQLQRVGERIAFNDPSRSILVWYGHPAAGGMPKNGNWPTADGTEAQARAAIDGWVAMRVKAESCACDESICSVAGDLVCANLLSSNQHCGACNAPCPAGMSCSGGKCAGSCSAGMTTCSGGCVDPTTDARNCGGCGQACAPGMICQNGQCGCPPGLSRCGSSCLDTTSDSRNCGACGNVCTSPASCVAGACASPRPHEMQIAFDNVDDVAYAWLSGWGNPQDPRQAFVCKVETGNVPRQKTCVLNGSGLNGETQGTIVVKIRNDWGDTSGNVTILSDGQEVWKGGQPKVGGKHLGWVWRVALRIDTVAGTAVPTPASSGKVNPDPCYAAFSCDY